jgi:hypothetical protein
VSAGGGSVAYAPPSDALGVLPCPELAALAVDWHAGGAVGGLHFARLDP